MKIWLDLCCEEMEKGEGPFCLASSSEDEEEEKKETSAVDFVNFNLSTSTFKTSCSHFPPLFELSHSLTHSPLPLHFSLSIP